MPSVAHERAVKSHPRIQHELCIRENEIKSQQKSNSAQKRRPSSLLPVYSLQNVGSSPTE